MQRLGLGRSSATRERTPSGQASNKSGFLEKAKAGMAHTTILPSVVGNKDLRLLQALITDEKAVRNAHERLGQDTNRAASALSAWGDEEGTDLADVCTRASEMLILLGVAYDKFAERQTDIRGIFKSIRTREEDLDEMKKKRKSVGNKAESAQRKLEKMTSENKNLQQQTMLLQSLKDEMRQLDTDILNEEARLSDFKRLSTKHALGIKFGGLLELAEKATIVGELGKLLIEEIPLDTTPPGYGRAPYHGFDKTSRLASETSKCVDEVVFAPPQVQLKPLDPTQLNLGGEPRFEEQSSRGDSSHGYRNDDQFAEFGDEPELPRRFRNDDDASSFPASPSSYLPQTASYQDTSGRSMVVLSADGQELPSSSTAPPQLSPAAQYRYSFTGPSETTTATARDGHEDGYGDLVPPGEGALPSGGVSTISRGPNAAREELDDGYGNLIPPGEGPASDADQDGSLSGYSRHARTDRPRIGGPRLSLGLGPTVGGGDFAATSAASTNTYGGTNSSSPPPMNNRRSLSIEQESYLPYDAPSPSEPAPTSAFPARRSSDQSFASELQPPSAPFAQPTTKEGQSPITEQETESYVDAPSRPGSSGTGGGRLSGDGSNAHSSSIPRPPYHSLSPSPSATSPSATATGFYPSYSSPLAPQSDHQLAAAAAQREVEREMDSLAFSSTAGSPTSYTSPSAGTFGSVSGDSGPRKINAGKFFKRTNSNQPSPSTSAPRFVPPPGSFTDGGISDDDFHAADRHNSTNAHHFEGEIPPPPPGNVEPLNLPSRSRGPTSSLRREEMEESAPPYA